MESIFFEVFEPLPRQGPGNRASTLRALESCAGLPEAPRIVDLGCGCGAQTLDLASVTSGTILAVDLHQPLIERLAADVARLGLSERVEVRVADMASLEPSGTFDLVWSEGALYNLGLDAALAVCAGLLQPGGYLAFTEAVWRTQDPPEDARRAFAEYPAMGDVAAVLDLLDRTGWEVFDHFPLPNEAWWDQFYAPMERRIEELRAQYTDSPDALAVLDEIAEEPRMHRRSGSTYGYEFFIARWR